ncbi:MAG: DUF4173 domain-containing protein [Anaerolineales bacterium]
MKRTLVLWITVLLLGWCFDFLFWKHAAGINFPIYVLLCLAGGFLVLGLNGCKLAWRSLLLLIPILFFAAGTLLRQEPLSLFLSFALTLGLMGLLAVSFLGGGWPWYSLPDYIVRFVRLAGSMVARPLMFLSERRKSAAAEAGAEGAAARPRTGWKRFWAIFRGVLIAIPIVAIFAALLSSADLVFAQRLYDFASLFRLENLPQYIFRLVYILIGAYALAGVFLHAAQKSQDEKLLGMEKPLVPQFLGFTEAAVVLGAVVLLFILFVIIQLRYFFGGGANIGVQGYTYSEYARRGFGELAAVAVCSLLLFLGLSAIVRRQNPAQRWAFSGLGIGMAALVGVILASAFQRLRLYEAAYGFSRLRMYTHIFMIWLGVLLAVVVLLELLRRERLFPLAVLLASIGFAATLVLINVDGSIVRLNVARAPQGKGLDVPFLASLSTDAVPALAAAYESPALPGLTRDAVGAVLVCRLHVVSASTHADWRGFTLAGLRADQAMAKVYSRLKTYQVTVDQGGVKILTPGSVYYECP